MEKRNVAIIALFSVSFFLLLISSISMLTTSVEGWNNRTTVTRAYVWNTNPNLTRVEISPDPINLLPGNTTEVNCTAFVWDYNGWEDVNVTEAVFYHNSVNYRDPDNNNNYYTIYDFGEDCFCVQDGAATNASCICTFDVWYYAYPGEWICNMTVTDKGGWATERLHFLNDSNNASAILNPVVAINVPEEIDYGNLSVTETSVDMPANISNFGNTEINISVRAYGGILDPSNPTLSSLICDLGNIPLEYERYSLSPDADFDVMTPVTNSTEHIGMSLPIRTNDEQLDDDTQTSYWKLRIPLTIGGSCEGTLEFTAEEI